MEKPSKFALRQIRTIADFQYGKGAGNALFSEDVTIERSRGTNRIRFIYMNNERICSFRVRDGYLVLSLLGGKILHKNGLGYNVVVNLDAEPFVRKGKTVFAKHVIEADEKIASKDEVIIVNQKGDFLGIGTAKLSAPLILEMNNGVAVDTRKGVEEEK